MSRKLGFLLPPVLAALLGAAIGFVSPVAYRSTGWVDAETPGGFSVPIQRHAELLRGSIRREEEAESFVGCLEAAAEEDPEVAANLLQHRDRLVKALEENGLTGSVARAADLGIPALEVVPQGESGYALEVFALAPGEGEGQLRLLTKTLRCWVGGFNRREPLHRSARLLEELDRVRERAGAPPFLSAAAAARRSELLALVARLDPDRDPLPPTSRAAAVLARLESLPPENLSAGVDRDRLRTELLRLSEEESIVEERRHRHDRELRRGTLRSWNQIYRLPETLPLPSLELRVGDLDRRLFLYPPINLAVLGFAAGLLLSGVVYLATRLGATARTSHGRAR